MDSHLENRNGDRRGGAITLSAVIVTYNSEAVIEGCVRSLRTSLPLAEVVVVDNASSDDTLARCERLGVTLIANRENAGYGRACNQGAAQATSAHVLFVNPDIEVVVVDRAALDAELRRRPFGLVGPVMRSGRHQVSGVRRHRHWTGDLLEHVAEPLRPRGLRPLPRLPARAASRWLSGAVLLVTRDEFRAIGGFDERYFLFYEDRDLARRYREAGMPIRQCSAITVRHQSGQSSTGEGATLAARDGWSYLSWIQYLHTWNGRRTAERAETATRMSRVAIDRALAVLGFSGPLASRARRKRGQLKEIEAFVSWQTSLAEGTAPPDYCPQARRIASQRMTVTRG